MAVEGNISHVEITKLLKILIEAGHHQLPKDARSLLETPRTMFVRKLDNGFYIHLGIKKFLDIYLRKPDLSDPVLLSFSVDGTPVSISGPNLLWPIFGAIHLRDIRAKYLKLKFSMDQANHYPSTTFCLNL